MDVEKEILCLEVPNLSRQDKINIMTIIKRHDQSKIQRFSDGSRIDLDSLPDELIMMLYSKIKYILKLDT